jgi:hypothetical protein
MRGAPERPDALILSDSVAGKFIQNHIISGMTIDENHVDIADISTIC